MAEETALTGWRLENSYKSLPNAFYTEMQPNSAAAPEVIVFNSPLAAALGLDEQMLQGDLAAEILAGARFPEGAEPVAEAYAGHQFGHFTMLGDGRAILLGERIDPSGKRYDIHLKGSGRTRYSRGGDGRAALGPMLREYIISEAMHGLKIPTTRSLAVTATGDHVARETALPGAVLARVAASHLRVGTFEYAARFCEKEELKALADYAIKRHDPELEADSEKYLSFLKKMIERQASLIAKWQLAGFIHGVMNTDNMAISGETIDYGPCAFMDSYDPETVFSSIDVQGRYAYGNQPAIGGWNLARFAETLLPLLHDSQEEAVEIAQAVITEYPKLYRQNWLDGMREKLGLFKEEKEDEKLIEDLLRLMYQNKADYTNTFSALAKGIHEEALSKDPEYAKWQERWRERLKKQEESDEQVTALLKKSNPAIIPRNHRVEEALEAAGKGDYEVMNRLLAVLRDPYAYSAEQEGYAKLPDTPDEPYRTYCGT
ncbi:YdiU family protein [Metabacillus sp. GX 13764]|uniref:protein adenylyltransferase SelO n=1 Tax=Metabacillus kandeliae TaxID=2900151 RepID=UPI001E2A60B2|nr:YdiU family protein [Metabacillus kandeliae]MCD7034235.1 YdiU family protein [Metabacillus kandeliae]